MSRFVMRSLNHLFSHSFWFNLSAFRLASPPGGMRLPPEGEPCMYYISEILVCFGLHLFVQAFLAKALSTSTQEGRPEPVVEV